MDIVGYDPEVRIRIPVDTEFGGSRPAAVDDAVIQVQVVVTGGKLPCTPAAVQIEIAVRFNPVPAGIAGFKGARFAGQEVGAVGVVTVQRFVVIAGARTLT